MIWKSGIRIHKTSLLSLETLDYLDQVLNSLSIFCSYFIGKPS